MKLSFKAGALIGLILAAFLLLIITGLTTLRYASSDDNKARVEQLFKSTYNQIIQLEQYVKSGEMPEEQAKELATLLLRNNKYHKSEYVYVADEKLNFIATPLDPELHGTSFHEFKDGKGNSVGNILQNAVNSNPNGIAEYNWSQKQADGHIEDKLSIARKTPVWGWYVGTGIGFSEVEARFWSSAKWQLIICALLIISLSLLLLWSTKRLLATLGGEPKEVLELVKRVASGDLTPSNSNHNVNQDSILGSTVLLSNSLSKIVSSIESSVKKLHQETENADKRTSEIDNTFENQKVEIEMIATAMTQMSSSSQTVANSAGEAAHSTQEADQQGALAHEIVNNAVESIETLDHK